MKPGTTSRVRLGLVLASCLAVAATVAPSAIAKEGAPTAPNYTTQAEAAGLTAGKARTLQGEVDRYLARLGGRQVSPNEIDLDGGAKAFVSLPGENHPRDFTTTRNLPAALDTPADTCPYGNFCPTVDRA